MHMDPLIPNHGAGHGPVLEPGMCFAVEPMVNLGTKDTLELADGWTVVDRRRPPFRPLRAHLRGHRGRPPGPHGP